jgi:hypothetical protein
VDDLNNAKILSWAAQGYMKTVVVENYESSKTLYSRGVKSWAKDGMVPYVIQSKNEQYKSRSEAQIRTGKLFGPNEIPGSNEMSSGIKGNPEYLVDLISLNDEALRDTLFYNVFKRALLFDDLDSAIEYRQFMVKKKRNVPTIFTRTGEKLPQEGQLDPIGGRLPENLDYIFGQMKPQHGNDYKYIEQDIEVCKKLLHSIETRDNINEELSNLNNFNEDYENKKEIIAAFQAEIKALNFSDKKRNSKRDREGERGNLVADGTLTKRNANNNDRTVSRVSNENRDKNSRKRLSMDLE